MPVVPGATEPVTANVTLLPTGRLTICVMLPVPGLVQLAPPLAVQVQLGDW